MVRQRGLLGTVDTGEVAAKLVGGTIQRGSGTTTAGSGAVVFAKAFGAAPTVMLTATGATPIILSSDNVTTSGFDVNALDNAGAGATGTFDWIAIG